MKVTTLGRLSWFYNRKASSNNFFVKKTIVQHTDLFVWVRFNNFYGRSEICYRVFLFCIALLDVFYENHDDFVVIVVVVVKMNLLL